MWENGNFPSKGRAPIKVDVELVSSENELPNRDLRNSTDPKILGKHFWILDYCLWVGEIPLL